MKKSTVALLILCAFTLGMSVFTALYSVTRTNKAIQAIGEVRYNAESQAKIDEATKDYEAIDRHLHLEKRVEGLDTLLNAQKEYARLAIKAASVADKRKAAEGLSEEAVQSKIDEARAVCERYFHSEEACGFVENYQDLCNLESAYHPEAGSGPTATPAPAQEEAAVPMC